MPRVVPLGEVTVAALGAEDLGELADVELVCVVAGGGSGPELVPTPAFCLITERVIIVMWGPRMKCGTGFGRLALAERPPRQGESRKPPGGKARAPWPRGLVLDSRDVTRGCVRTARR